MVVEPATCRSALSVACCRLTSGWSTLSTKSLQVADLVLHGQRHFDDVLVLGEHLPLLAVRTLAGDVLLEALVDRREVEVQAGTDRLVILAEAQDDRLLLLVHHIDGVVQPEHGEDRQADAEQAQATALAAGTGAGTVATAFFPPNSPFRLS